MKAIIYGKPGCPSCTNAVTFCKENNINYEYKTVGTDVTKEQLLEIVGKPVRTVPQIFLSESGFFEHVGGYDEMRQRMS